MYSEGYSMSPREEALLRVREVIETSGDGRVRHSYYLEFHRRLQILELVAEYCGGRRVIDFGASPFITSCALKNMGFEVLAVDFDPEEYRRIAEACGIRAVRVDLEKDRVPVEDGWADCAVFSEVLEHINPYYVDHTVSEINRVLRVGGILVLTTPNIASLFRRLRLLLGIQPQYRFHVHEYTKREVEDLLEKLGFRILRSFYSEVNDLTYVDINNDEYLDLGTYRQLLLLALKKPTRLNILRLFAYPLVKTFPGLKMLIVVAAEKASTSAEAKVYRW